MLLHSRPRDLGWWLAKSLVLLVDSAWDARIDELNNPLIQDSEMELSKPGTSGTRR
jgi:hypothetical protein